MIKIENYRLLSIENVRKYIEGLEAASKNGDLNIMGAAYLQEMRSWVELPAEKREDWIRRDSLAKKANQTRREFLQVHRIPADQVEYRNAEKLADPRALKDVFDEYDAILKGEKIHHTRCFQLRLPKIF